MSKLPAISGKKLLKVLLKNGYYIRRQKGSHVHLRHSVRKPITIPNHRVIAKGTLLEILKQTGLKKEDLK